MTIHQLLRILTARKWWIALSVVVLVALAAAATLIVPPRYAATASVVINSRGSDPLTLSAGGQPQVSSISLGTQMEIIKRPRVAKRVIADLHLAADPALREAWTRSGTPLPFETWLSGVVVAGLTTFNGPDSNVIDIIYTSRDPENSARMANAFAEAYLATSLELKTDPARQYVAFFDERIADLRKRVEAAQARLSAFDKSTGLVSAAGKIDVETARLSELSTQLAAAQAQLADSSSRQSGSVANAAISPEVMQNPVIQSLKGQVSAQQVKIKELTLRLGPNHPELLRAQGQLAELQQTLSAEIGQVASSLGAAGRVSATRVAEIQALLDAQRQRVLSLQEQRDQSDVLQREVDNAQRAFDLTMQRQSQTTLESQAQQTDVALLDRATIPGSPSWPNVPLVIALAIVVGLLIGVVLALAREYLSPVVRTNEDVLIHSGLPVLAVIPAARNLIHGSRRPLLGRSRDRRALTN